MATSSRWFCLGFRVYLLVGNVVEDVKEVPRAEVQGRLGWGGGGLGVGGEESRRFGGVGERVVGGVRV